METETKTTPVKLTAEAIAAIEKAINSKTSYAEVRIEKDGKIAVIEQSRRLRYKQDEPK
jgi:hypothetical protein